MWEATVGKAVQFDDPTAYVAAQVAKYQQRNRVLQEIVSKGDRIRATATGFEQVDNRKCTCKTYGARRKDHAEECAVEIVTDPGPVIAALKEIRAQRLIPGRPAEAGGRPGRIASRR